MRIDPNTVQNVKSPDYLIRLGCRRILVEVKQLDPSSDDRDYNRRILEGEEPEVREVRTKYRIRRKIDRAIPQLKQRKHRFQPTILVLYSNLPLDGRQIQPHHILEAMYGDEGEIIALPDRYSANVMSLGRVFGGGRKVSPEYNSTLSSILNLYNDWNSGELCGIFYHNIYASARIKEKWVRGQRIRHFAIRKAHPSAFRDWEEM